MTEVLQHTNKTVESLVEQEVRTFSFDKQQATLLRTFSEELAAMGGPQAAGAKSKASLAATELKFSFSKDQCELLGAYSDGLVSLLIFEGMQTFTETSPPDELPELAALENRHDVLCLAARNQILLKLVDNSSFAYDMDNEGKLVRLVANFKGGVAKTTSTVTLAQGLAQDAPERRQPRAGGQEPERSRLPIGVVMQGATAQLAETQRIANL